MSGLAEIQIVCPQCRRTTGKPTGAVNRARRKGAPIYCGKECSGKGRRKNLSPEYLKERKRVYDREYRQKNRAMLKAKKAEYFKRTYDPKKAAVIRQGRAAQHNEYCRRPRYRAWKKVYDRQYRAKRDYGEFWESYLHLLEIDEEIKARASRYEIYQINGTLNKALKRKREYDKGNPVGKSSEISSLGHIG